jgi:hypothetical protein
VIVGELVRAMAKSLKGCDRKTVGVTIARMDCGLALLMDLLSIPSGDTAGFEQRLLRDQIVLR